MSSRTENAVRNIVWGILEKIISLLLPFITRTLVIKKLGAEYLGLSSIFTSILSVLSITELGFGSAIVFSMYRPVAENNQDTICALLTLYRRVYRVIGSVIFAVGMLLTPFLPHLINGKVPENVNLYVLYFIYLSNTVISYFLFAYKAALFSAFQRNDIISKRGVIISGVSKSLEIISLLILSNFYAYVIIVPFSTLLTNIINAVFAKKMYPELECRGEVGKVQKKEIKNRVVGLLSFKIYGVIFSSVDSIVISAYLGLISLSIYSNYYYIQTTIIGFLTIITSSITAGIGNKIVIDSKEENYLFFKKIVFANAWLVSWFGICLACLYQPFMRIWVGDELMFPSLTMILMVFYFLLPRITNVTYTYREAAGLWYEDRFRPLIASIVNLSLNIWWVKKIGINGIILSTVFCSMFINIPWGTIILFKHYFKRSPTEYFLTLFQYLAVTVVVGGVTFFLTEIISESGLSAFVFKTLICIFVPNTMFLMVYRKKNEYKYFLGLISTLKNKKIKHIFNGGA